MYPNAITYQIIKMEGVADVDFLECKICGSHAGDLKYHLEINHNSNISEYLEKYPNSKINLNEKVFEGTENIDYVECKICFHKGENILPHIRKRHNIDAYKYYELHPGTQIYCSKIKETFGSHMKTDEYRKKFSEMLKGENNGMHRSRRTEQQLLENSPFALEFYIKRYPNLSPEEVRELHKKYHAEYTKNRVSNTQLEYYTRQGMSIEDATSALKERQTTFSLEKCIVKYGEEKGLEKFNERQEKWVNSINSGGNMKIGYSRVSQKFFKELEQLRPGNYQYASKNGELKLKREEGNVYMYDFLDIDSKKIIEFHGDLFHANPEKFNESDNYHPYRKELLARDAWKRDEDRKMTAKNSGYDLMVVWESEYQNNNKDDLKKLFDRCIDYLDS